uniref:Uncharacterized protein n=1 Tax=Anguilla anguilla TaxID=7936 RepID=A0A0E9T0V4_ANGAN
MFWVCLNVCDICFTAQLSWF